MKLVPERVDSNAVVADLDEYLQAPPQMDRYLQGFQQGLLGNKADYDQAQKVFINPNSTDEQRQSAQLAMNQAHDRANYTRDLAKRMGYNLDNYGANTSLDEATKKYQFEQANLQRQLLKRDMSSEQYFDETFRALHEAGLPRNQAWNEAMRRANLYKAQRLAKWNTAIQMYGLNGDGTFNDFATLAFGNTMSDSPELAELYYKTYASPGKAYDNNVIAAREQAARNDNAAMELVKNQNALEKLARTHQYNMDYGAQQQQYKQDNIKLTGQENRKTTEVSQNHQATIDEEKDARKLAHDRELKILEGQIKEAARAGDIQQALKIHEGKKIIDKRYGIKSDNEKDTTEKDLKMLETLQEKFNTWKEQNPGASDRSNPWYSQVDEYRDRAMGRFKGDPSDYNVAWSWITDFMEKWAVDLQHKATRADVQAFAYGNFPKWIAENIIDILERNNYNGFTAD